MASQTAATARSNFNLLWLVSFCSEHWEKGGGGVCERVGEDNGGCRRHHCMGCEYFSCGMEVTITHPTPISLGRVRLMTPVDMDLYR